MYCQLRTIGAGIGVLAICFMLASLSWQFVLIGFALASVAWAVWSWSIQLSPRKPQQQPEAPLSFDRPRRARASNLVSFPAQEWGNQGSGY